MRPYATRVEGIGQFTSSQSCQRQAYSVYLLYWYKSTNTGVRCGHICRKEEPNLLLHYLMLLDYYTDYYFTTGSGTRMQPKLHMSTVVVYWVSPSMISGGRYQCVTRRSVYLPPHLYSIARAMPKSAIFAFVLKKKDAISSSKAL